MMALDVLEVEANNTESQSTRFEFSGQADVRLLGSSSGHDDRDYFAFTAPSDMRVNVRVASAGGAKLEVNTGSGTQVFENEPKDGLNSGTWLASAGETYLLRMRAPDRSPAAYEVTLDAGQGSGSSNNDSNSGLDSSTNITSGVEVEPNNKPEVATSVGLSASAPVTLSGSASKRDRDFFRVQSDSAGIVTIDTGNSGIKVSLETVRGTKLFESEPRDGIARGNFEVQAGEVFLVRARGTTGDVTQYSLALTLAAGTATGTTGTGSTADTGAPSASVLDAWLDASDDGIVSPLDALMVINYINAHGEGHGADDALLELDTNDDRAVSALDVLLVINRINQHGSSDINDAFDDSDIRKRVRQ